MLRDVIAAILQEFDESLHPRGYHGKFAATGKSPNRQMRLIRSRYIARIAPRPRRVQPYHRVSEKRGKRIADHYESAPHEPAHPEVKRSYDALKKETLDQYDHLTQSGVRFERWAGKGEPYADSKAAMTDLRDHHHLYFLPTEGAFGEESVPSDHPLLEVAPRTLDGKPLLYNDVFRAVHDTFGHGPEGWQFGARGEENAWISHAAMYSDDAKMALAVETRAQNSWVNYGRHLRRPDGSIPKKGEEGFVPPQDRPFASQKAIRLPREMWDPAYSDTVTEKLFPGTTPAVHDALVRGVKDIKEPDGGFSIDMKTGAAARQPGYMVAIRGHEATIPVRLIAPSHIEDFARKHKTALAQEGNFLGGWHEVIDGTSTGQSYLDVSRRIENIDAAMQMAREHGQVAIFDLSTFQSIPVV